MFKREDYIKKVAYFLAVLEVNIRNTGFLRLLDLNIVAETFFADFLNILHGLKLENLNNIDRSNMPGIDLGDTDNKIAYQVTSTKTGEKIQKTIDKFIKEELHKKFDSLNILILGTKQQTYNTVQTHGLAFSVKDNILDIKDLINALEVLTGDKLKSLCGLIERETHLSLDEPRGEKLFLLPSTHRKNPFFISKPEVAIALDSLQPGDTLVLCGPPGVGKTQHAVQYAHEKIDLYKTVLWASAESEQSLNQSLVSLAESILPATEIYDSNNVKVSALLRWLSIEKEWLLILDNADLANVAREIEKVIPAVHHGHIIVTSQFTDWTPAFKKERIDVWTEEQSSEFLKKRLSRCADDNANLIQLSKELGGLPLALEQAAAYIDETSSSVSKYIELLNQNRRQILKRKHLGMTAYRASVAVTWQVSVSRLSWLARQILHYAACLSSDPIPRSILSHLLSSSTGGLVQSAYGPFERQQLHRALSNPDAVNLALAELGKYSLIKLSNESFQLHSLLQYVVLNFPRLRPWQARYWLCKIWAIKPAGLWLYRTAYLLTMEGVLPDDKGELGIFNMRPFIAHLQTLNHNIETIAPRLYSLIAISPLRFKIKWLGERSNRYQSGMSVLRELLVSNAQRSPHLIDETEWFLAHIEGFYKQVIEKSNIGYYLHCLSEVDGKDVRHKLYFFLNIFARKYAEFGEPESSKRLFNLYLSHVTDDPEASEIEIARAYLYKSLSLRKHLPPDELQSLLETALSMNESDERINPDVCNAIILYSTIAKTPERQSRALGWIRGALPQARAYFAIGGNHACVLTTEYVRIIGDDESDEALLACEETLLLALRSRKLTRMYSTNPLSLESVTTLWRQRGSLLLKRQHFLASARSYARCLALELQYGEPTPFQQINLHFITGEMYLNATMIPAARKYLLKAHDLLEIYWSDDSLSDNSPDAKDYAALVGFALGQIHEDVKAEALLRRASVQPYAGSGMNGTKPGWIHFMLATFLRERGRIEEADSEMRRVIELQTLNTQSTESPSE